MRRPAMRRPGRQLARSLTIERDTFARSCSLFWALSVMTNLKGLPAHEDFNLRRFAISVQRGLRPDTYIEWPKAKFGREIPEPLKVLARKCWSEDPNSRPTISDCHKDLIGV